MHDRGHTKVHLVPSASARPWARALHEVVAAVRMKRDVTVSNVSDLAPTSSMGSRQCSAYGADTGRTEIIAGRFSVRELLGAGGMGIVYLADRLTDGQPVALKVLRSEYASDARVCERLRREAEAVQRIEHPGVVRLVEFGTAPDVGPYVAFEHLEGNTLTDLLADRGHLPVRTALHIAESILAALEAAHEAGVIHRDLKPDNIHLAGDGPEPHVTVLDFGISRLLNDVPDGMDARLTRTGTIVGTPVYMAPEQAIGNGVQDERADVYAVGVLLYEMLSGAVPHDGENCGQILAHVLHGTPIPLSLRAPGVVDEALEELIERAIERDPRSRYASAAEFRAALRAWRDAPMRPALSPCASTPGSLPGLVPENRSDREPEFARDVVVRIAATMPPAPMLIAGLLWILVTSVGLIGLASAPRGIRHFDRMSAVATALPTTGASADSQVPQLATNATARQTSSRHVARNGRSSVHVVRSQPRVIARRSARVTLLDARQVATASRSAPVIGLVTRNPYRSQ